MAINHTSLAALKHVSLWGSRRLSTNSSYRETDSRSLIELKDELWLNVRLHPSGTSSGKSNLGFALPMCQKKKSISRRVSKTSFKGLPGNQVPDSLDVDRHRNGRGEAFPGAPLLPHPTPWAPRLPRPTSPGLEGAVMLQTLPSPQRGSERTQNALLHSAASGGHFPILLPREKTSVKVQR